MAQTTLWMTSQLSGRTLPLPLRRNPHTSLRRGLFRPTAALRNAPTATERLLDVLNLVKRSKITTSAASKVDERYRVFLDQWDKGFMDAHEDPEGYFVDCVYGEIPRDLEGTLFRNGPGRFTVGERKIDHPYDGDGFVASVAIKDGKAFFRSRFVRTPEFAAETAAGEVLFRGTFATQRLGGQSANFGDLYVKNTSNTNVCAWAGRLWTLFEAGQPYRLNPYTLDTIGMDLLDGALRPGLPFNLGSTESNASFGSLARKAHATAAPEAIPRELLNAGGDAVTAHPSIDPVTGRLIFFSYRVRPVVPSGLGKLPVETELTFWELDGEAKPVVRRRINLDGFAFLHDFAITENYYVIFQNPVTVDNVPYLMGTAPAASCIRWVPNTPTLVHLVPRDGSAASINSSTTSSAPSSSDHSSASTSSAALNGTAAQLEEPLDVTSRVRTFTAPPLFVFHHANAFEENGSVIIDSIHYISLPAVGREALASQQVDPDAAFTSRLRRVELNLNTNVLKVRTAFDAYLEMPVINPQYMARRHKYVYGYHSVFEDPQIGVAKINVEGREAEIWKPGPNRFALEPRFVPRSKSTKSLGKQVIGAEDDGWLVVQLLDTSEMRSEIVILNASDLSKGPVAVLALKDALPSGLHSCWSEEYYGPSVADEAGQRAKHVEANVVPFSGAEAARLKGRSEKRRSVGNVVRDAVQRATVVLLPLAGSVFGNGTNGGA